MSIVLIVIVSVWCYWTVSSLGSYLLHLWCRPGPVIDINMSITSVMTDGENNGFIWTLDIICHFETRLLEFWVKDPFYLFTFTSEIVQGGSRYLMFLGKTNLGKTNKNNNILQSTEEKNNSFVLHSKIVTVLYIRLKAQRNFIVAVLHKNWNEWMEPNFVQRVYFKVTINN